MSLSAGTSASGVNISVATDGTVTVDPTALVNKCKSKCKGKINSCTAGLMDMISPMCDAIKQASAMKSQAEQMKKDISSLMAAASGS